MPYHAVDLFMKGNDDMLNIAVCDDETLEIEYLTSLTRQWAKSTETAVNILSFPSAEAFLFEYEENKNFDIILLDIQMSGINGIKLAEKIRENDGGMQIVFITGFPDYIAKGYDVSALHYLIKPVEKEKLFEILARACDNLKREDKYILLSAGDESFKIKLKDIFYIEAFGHSCRVVCEKNEYTVRYPVSDIAKMLDESFIFSHRSYIVNIGHISSITKTDIRFDGGKTVPISRRMYNDVNAAFIDFYRGASR